MVRVTSPGIMTMASGGVWLREMEACTSPDKWAWWSLNSFSLAMSCVFRIASFSSAAESSLSDFWAMLASLMSCVCSVTSSISMAWDASSMRVWSLLASSIALAVCCSSASGAGLGAGVGAGVFFACAGVAASKVASSRLAGVLSRIGKACGQEGSSCHFFGLWQVQPL